MEKNTLHSLTFSNPTETIVALISKFSLSLLILAAGILFFQMSEQNTSSSKIPKKISIYMSIFLIFLSCSISIFSTIEFHSVFPKYISASNSSNSLYTTIMLKSIIIFYTAFSVLFIIANMCIAFVLLKYHK